jgi:hypothetical protein
VGLVCPLRVEGAGAKRSLVCEGAATVVLGPPGDAAGSCAGALITADSTPPARLVMAGGERAPGHGITVCHGVIRVPMEVSVVNVVER